MVAWTTSACVAGLLSTSAFVPPPPSSSSSSLGGGWKVEEEIHRRGKAASFSSAPPHLLSTMTRSWRRSSAEEQSSSVRNGASSFYFAPVSLEDPYPPSTALSLWRPRMGREPVLDSHEEEDHRPISAGFVSHLLQTIREDGEGTEKQSISKQIERFRNDFRKGRSHDFHGTPKTQQHSQSKDSPPPLLEKYKALKWNKDRILPERDQQILINVNGIRRRISNTLQKAFQDLPDPIKEKLTRAHRLSKTTQFKVLSHVVFAMTGVGGRLLRKLSIHRAVYWVNVGILRAMNPLIGKVYKESFQYIPREVVKVFGENMMYYMEIDDAQRLMKDNHWPKIYQEQVWWIRSHLNLVRYLFFNVLDENGRVWVTRYAMLHVVSDEGAGLMCQDSFSSFIRQSVRRSGFQNCVSLLMEVQMVKVLIRLSRNYLHYAFTRHGVNLIRHAVSVAFPSNTLPPI